MIELKPELKIVNPLLSERNAEREAGRILRKMWEEIGRMFVVKLLPLRFGRQYSSDYSLWKRSERYMKKKNKLYHSRCDRVKHGGMLEKYQLLATIRRTQSSVKVFTIRHRADHKTSRTGGYSIWNEITRISPHDIDEINTFAQEFLDKELEEQGKTWESQKMGSSTFGYWEVAE